MIVLSSENCAQKSSSATIWKQGNTVGKAVPLVSKNSLLVKMMEDDGKREELLKLISDPAIKQPGSALGDERCFKPSFRF
jgi:hypothetical protein